ncbi:MAG: hypothetical protein HYY37_05680 [Candidatus Aenigmarchaeota archaeon]|nr:hypothetical protein [Candidatus Aenigmarchaeota archaeon]
MTTKAPPWIHVPALMDGSNVVVPQFWLGEDVEYRRDGRCALSPAGYNSRMQLPTLAELRYAYCGRNPDGSFVSPDYKQSVRSMRGRGEWTSTFLRDGREAIENPENFVCRNGIWVVEGGKVSPVELPPDGWTLEYDKPTGFPSRTSQERRNAEGVFGNDASYFYRNTRGVRAVLRNFGLNDSGPFYVNASYGPADGDSYVGARSCRREPDTRNASVDVGQSMERRALPVYAMGQAEYDALLQLAQGNPQLEEILSRIRRQA